MFVTFVFVAVFVVTFIAVNRSNKFVYAIAILTSAVLLLMLSATIYSAKVSSYRFFFDIDYKIVYFFYNIRMSLAGSVRLYNLGLAVLMSASALCFAIFSGLKRRYLPFLFLPIIAVYYWISPEISYLVYIQTSQGISSSSFFFIVEKLTETVFWIYLFAPLAILVKQIITTKIFTRRKDLLALGGCILLLDIFVMFTFRFGEFSHIWFTNVDFTKLPLQTDFNSAIIPFMLLLMVGAIAAILLCFRPFNIFSIVHRDKMIKQRKMLNHNLSMQFHIYKNAFLALGQQINLMKLHCDQGDMERIMRGLDISSNIVGENMTSLERTLLLLQNENKRFLRAEVDLSACIKESIDRVIGDMDVTLRGNYSSVGSMLIYGDRKDVIECFVNVLVNALESVRAAGRHPELEINAYTEDIYHMIEIVDNGIGLERKNLEHIFEAFYSTKAQRKGGGVGLNYVKNVVLWHRGEIRALSKQGEYAKFQMVFRTDMKDRRRLKKAAREKGVIATVKNLI